MVAIPEPPELRTMNLCGTTFLGARDMDEATGSYVGNRALVILMIPICFLAAYRVKDAPGGGWYFLGQVPLSDRARRWNAIAAPIALAGASLAFAWWSVVPCFNQPETAWHVIGTVLAGITIAGPVWAMIGLRKLR